MKKGNKASKEIKRMQKRLAKKQREFLDRQNKKFIKEKCEDCGTIENLTIHHIVPISKGGENKPENYQVLCRSCHDKVHGINSNAQRKIHGQNARLTKLMYSAGHDATTISKVLNLDINLVGDYLFSK